MALKFAEKAAGKKLSQNSDNKPRNKEIFKEKIKISWEKKKSCR